MNPGSVRVVFMGSPAFAVPSLRALVMAGYDVVAVLSQPDRPAGRGGRLAAPEVKLAAIELGIPVLQFETLKDESALAALRDCRGDLFVVAAYGKILSRAVLAMPARGSVNVHASLLPRWRGPSPITAAILAGDAETGVSIMEVAPKMDAGAVIAAESIPIAESDTAATLEPRLAELGARLLVEALPAWYERSRAATPQNDALATYCPLLRKEDGHLRQGMTAAAAERTIRAYEPWPGAFVLYRGERLAIWKAHIEPLPGPLADGTLILAGRSPAIAFGDALLVLDEVQRTGARRQPGRDFVNGERGYLQPTVTLL